MHYKNLAQLFLYSIACLTLSSATKTAPSFSTTIKRGADIVPFTSLGGIAAVIRSPTESQIYWQNTDGSIWAYDTMGGATFPPSHTFFNELLVPAGTAMRGTPLRAVQLASGVIHLFFIDPNNILSEWIWTGSGWEHGPGCASCISFAVAPADGNVEHKIAYVLYDTPPGLVRVGFVSAAAPSTLSEAVLSGGVWTLTTLPN